MSFEFSTMIEHWYRERHDRDIQDRGKEIPRSRRREIFPRTKHVLCIRCLCPVFLESWG